MQTHTHHEGVREKRWENKEYLQSVTTLPGGALVGTLPCWLLLWAVASWGARGVGILLLPEHKGTT